MDDTKTTCSSCGEEKEIDEHIDGDAVCSECVIKAIDNGDIERCTNCDEYTASENIRYVELSVGNDSLCETCASIHTFCCENCGDLRYLSDRDIDHSELCSYCALELLDDESSEEHMDDLRLRSFDRSCSEFQSKTKGDIIKSKRKFGIELEMLNTDVSEANKFAYEIPESFGLDHDGSIRGEGIGIELVSPILSGSAGENAIREVLERVRSRGFFSNTSCGLHVHLDAPDFKNTSKIDIGTIALPPDITSYDSTKQVLFLVKKDVMEELRQVAGVEKGEVAQLLFEEALSGGNKIFLSKTLDNPVKPILIKNISWEVDDMSINSNLFTELKSPNEMEKKYGSIFRDRSNLIPEPDDYVVLMEPKSNLRNVKTLLYFYTVFGDVISAMLPSSRRERNMYCQSLTASFAPNQIEDITSYSELESAWYKTKTLYDTRSKKGQRYDDSRYYGVNLHSLFAKYGTVEIRMHGATFSHYKVLYWVAFHQLILDRIAKGDISIERMRGSALLYGVDSKLRSMLELLDPSDELKNYIIKRINYFNKK